VTSTVEAVTAPDVTVVGCGRMGSALARVLAAGGSRVGVWNRTPGRAVELAATEGIAFFDDVADAVTATPLVVACTATYGSTREALDPVTDWSGSTLVNFATGPPHEARAMEAWASDRGATYLDGVLLTFPSFVGHEDAMVVYAGARATWERHQETLMTLGRASCHVADDPGTANALDTAVIGSFYISAVTAYVESAAYALAEGVPSEVLRAATRLVVRTLGRSTKEALAALDTGQHTADQATLATYAAGSRHGLVAMHAAGHPARMLGAASASLLAAERAGLGDLGIYAQALALAPRSPTRGSSAGASANAVTTD
jgi:3-hydroxyisobutyrate dehydrogenase-like beta-hydroxyacid dehydrogenase